MSYTSETSSPKRAMSMEVRAAQLVETGRLHDALRVYQDMRQDFGTQQKMAGIMHQLGDFEGALQIYEHLVDVLDDPDRLNALNSMACTLKDMGRLQEALDIFERTIPIQANSVGTRHEQHLTARDNMADLLRQLGRKREAMAILQQVEEVRKEVLGAQHPQYLSTLNNLAGLIQDEGDKARALTLYRQVSKGIDKRHPSHAIVVSNMASVMAETGDLDGALKVYKKVRALQLKTLGQDHPSYLSTLNSMAGILYKKKDLFGTLSLLNTVQEGWRKINQTHRRRTALTRMHQLISQSLQ